MTSAALVARAVGRSVADGPTRMWLARASLGVLVVGVVGMIAVSSWSSRSKSRCAAHVQIQAEMNKQLTMLLQADLANSATPDEAREMDRLRRRLAQLAEIREGPPGEDAVVVPNRVMEDLLGKARKYDALVDEADPLKVKVRQAAGRSALNCSRRWRLRFERC